MRRSAALLLLAPLLLTACSLFRRPSPEAGPQPRYVVGPAYRVGDSWFYPREDFHLDATGLAVVLPDRPGTTADNEPWDSNAMAGAHATLQLPAVARVTNLDAGLQALIRINDRGPANPGRLIGLTRRAADRLGIMPGDVGRVRIQVDDELSQALRDSLLGAAAVTVSSAPRGKVASEPLAPPPGLAQSPRHRAVAAFMPAAASTAAPAASPASLPDTAVRVPPHPGQLWLRAGEFGQAAYADQVRSRLARLAATIERLRHGRSSVFRVRAGPFADVTAADLALDQATRAGVTDARIVVE